MLDNRAPAHGVIKGGNSSKCLRARQLHQVCQEPGNDALAFHLPIMKTSRLFLFLALPILSVLAGCDKKEAKVLVETDSGNVVAVKASEVLWPAVEETVKSQVSALNREDVAGYMSYIHPDSPGALATRDNLDATFNEYDLKTTLEKLEPVTLNDGEAKVHFIQLTEKLSGPAFRNNRVSGTHILRKDGGVWKVFSTVQDNLDYLDPAS